MKDNLTASEAIYGFCGWLTGQKETTKMGASNDCGNIAEKVDKFCKENKLKEPRKTWDKNLKHPS